MVEEVDPRRVSFGRQGESVFTAGSLAEMMYITSHGDFSLGSGMAGDSALAARASEKGRVTIIEL